MAVHDYSKRAWGHNYDVMRVEDGGKLLRVAGWGLGINVNDFILLAHRNGDTSRYRVDKIEYQRDPRDMWFADLSFAPRPLGAQHESAVRVAHSLNIDAETK